MATLTVNTINRAGFQDALVAATGGGDAVACSMDTWIEVNNGGGSPITVTLNVPAAITANNETISNRTVSVTNGTRKKIGPINPLLYQDPTTNLCSITYSAVTSVTVGAFNMPPS